MFSKRILVAFALSLALVGCGSDDMVSSESAKTNVEGFINDSLLGANVTAAVTSIEKDSGLYKLEIELVQDGSEEKQEVVSYVTLDGTKFIPEMMDIAEMKAEVEQKEAQEKLAKEIEILETPKTSHPIAELFVMSHCPFGTQIEKGILPVIDALGDKVDFQLKFVNYVMHGDKEIKEQTRQFCIQKDFSDKLISYLKEFLKEGDSDAALAAVGIDASTLEDCVAVADEEFKITENFEDKDSWLSGQFPKFEIHAEDNKKYDVKGSPAFVVNGKVIAGADRSPAGLLTAVCAGFENAPEECSTELSVQVPGAGFGEGVGTNGGSCS